MGCFDTVPYILPCPVCGKQVTDFQTKDVGQGLQTISVRTMWELWVLRNPGLTKSPNGPEMHAICTCGTYISVGIGSAPLLYPSTGRGPVFPSLDELEDDSDLTIVDDPAFYRGLFQRWRSEVLFQVAKVARLKGRLEDVRDLLRGLERADYADSALRQQLHKAVFG